MDTPTELYVLMCYLLALISFWKLENTVSHIYIYSNTAEACESSGLHNWCPNRNLFFVKILFIRYRNSQELHTESIGFFLCLQKYKKSFIVICKYESNSKYKTHLEKHRKSKPNVISRSFKIKNPFWEEEIYKYKANLLICFCLLCYKYSIKLA